MPRRYGAERSSMRTRAHPRAPSPSTCSAAYWDRFLKYMLRDFSPIALFMLTGTPLLAGNFLFGPYAWRQSMVADEFTIDGTVMLSVLPFLVGFELVLQALVLEIRDTPR